MKGKYELYYQYILQLGGYQVKYDISIVIYISSVQMLQVKSPNEIILEIHEITLKGLQLNILWFLFENILVCLLQIEEATNKVWRVCFNVYFLYLICVL